MDQEVSIILSHPFLATERAIVGLELGEMKFKMQKDAVSFKISKSKRQTLELQVVCVVDVYNDKMNEEEFEDPPLE